MTLAIIKDEQHVILSVDELKQLLNEDREQVVLQALHNYKPKENPNDRFYIDQLEEISDYTRAYIPIRIRDLGIPLRGTKAKYITREFLPYFLTGKK